MVRRTKIIVLAAAGLVAVVGAAALLRQDDIKPIGRLSLDEVRQVRAVVGRSCLPRWSWFRLANFRQWPSFVTMVLTFRVVDIRPDSIWVTTVHPKNGTTDDSGVTVWYTYFGCPTNACPVQKWNGEWRVAPLQASLLHRP
jgi:hypothetical protein